MIKFLEATLDDIPQIAAWSKSDPYHLHQDCPEWWLGDGAVLAFCLLDECGPLTYVRLDAEGEYVRMHVQFPPESVVSKSRLAKGIIHCQLTLSEYFKGSDYWGFIFNSTSPSLIAFMGRLGFVRVGDTDDYRLDFEGRL
jgi:hypothetical protein